MGQIFLNKGSKQHQSSHNATLPFYRTTEGLLSYIGPNKYLLDQWPQARQAQTDLLLGSTGTLQPQLETRPPSTGVMYLSLSQAAECKAPVALQ